MSLLEMGFVFLFTSYERIFELGTISLLLMKIGSRFYRAGMDFILKIRVRYTHVMSSLAEF